MWNLWILVAEFAPCYVRFEHYQSSLDTHVLVTQNGIGSKRRASSLFAQTLRGNTCSGLPLFPLVNCSAGFGTICPTTPICRTVCRSFTRRFDNSASLSQQLTCICGMEATLLC
jgi:hypothetical protein